MSYVEKGGRPPFVCVKSVTGVDFFVVNGYIPLPTPTSGIRCQQPFLILDSYPLIEAIAAMGYEEPTPIQAQAIPFLLENQQDPLRWLKREQGKQRFFTPMFT